MHHRARAVRAKAAIRRWQYRQRNLAAGVWYRLRRILADAKEAYVISVSDSEQLIAEGYKLEACGAQLSPEKAIIFVDPARLGQITSRRRIPIRLDPDFLLAPSVALVRFD
jgi:hypothetical protein